MADEKWGRTGKVTIGHGTTGPSVFVYGRFIGEVTVIQYGEQAGLWFASDMYSMRCLQSEDLPTRDAAIMWLLRHVVPAVWRAERPVVYRVQRCPTGYHREREIWSGEGIDVQFHWRHKSVEKLIHTADELARSEYARTVSE